MYLKSIEVHGFKSFANKLVFDFHDGITAIVGPNGSGKSNVGDAVRWVLGEQSAKQLRGAKMEDVIFSGTEARKPLGYAYVAITLDNSDHKLPIAYEEVKVARRVFRSGESEYLINGSHCRLRDVQELFLDTGIGKEGYSIIGQGQIEKILSGKPEDRRELFDEAAGIVKFKKRKIQAEKNLEIEKQNLYRINDILSEIEKQVGPLEKQSIVAKEYLKLRDQLKILDVNMFLLEYERISQSRKEYEDKLHIANEDLVHTKEECELAKKEYEKLEGQLEEKTISLDENRVHLSEEKVKREQLDGQIKVLNEQIQAAKQSDSHYTSRKNAIDDDIVNRKNELNQFLESKQEIDQKILAFHQNQQNVEEQLQYTTQFIAQMNHQIEEFNSEIFEFLSENSNIKTKMQRYETMLEQSNIKKVGLNQKLLKFKSDEAIFNEKIQEEQETLDLILQSIHTKTSSMKDMNQQIENISSMIHMKKTNLDESQQVFHREQSRHDSLVNITERYDGYGMSIRKIMEEKHNRPGIHGVVADIIQVNKEYEIAVETALGGSIQNIVTDNEATAKQMIEFLKKNRYGRATFLPLTSITNKNAFYKDEALKEEGVIGLASSLVHTKSEYSGLVDYLLGRIVVVDHIDHAIKLAKKYHYSLRIVTTEGELFSPGGSMSGGAYKNNSNLLGRRREIDEAKKKIDSVKETMIQLSREIESLQTERSAYRDQIAQIEKELQDMYISQNTANLQIKQAKAGRDALYESYHEIRNESTELESQVKELRANLDELSKELEVNVQKSQDNEHKIAKLHLDLEEQKKKEHEISEQLSAIRIEASSIEQTSQYNQENISRIRREIHKLEDEKGRIDSDLETAQSQIKEKEEAILTIHEQIKKSNERLEQYELTIQDVQKEKEEITNQHKSFFTKREELSSRMSELDKECYRITNLLDKLQDQLDQNMNYMWEEYEITYSGAMEMRSDEMTSILEIRKSTTYLKQSIKDLGDVNVNAIEDFKNLMERFDLLRNQRDDLVKAEEALQGIIAELDFEMRKQFEEKFKEIKEEFDIVFKELFGGGKGTLELVEEEDILEAGIRIIAQPPGKKLQNMMQLSGGEKSLTAISLLFAIQNLKPSPFCLLDEIEAALDDSNVTRFASYLKKLTNHTQFIVITHRRGTMSSADRLYGITMQEKGISTLVSVNLIESQLAK